jgi:nitrate/nitrite transporter NarK
LLLTATTSDKYIAVACLTLGYGAMDCMLPVAWAVCLDVGGKYTGSVTGSMNMAGQVGAFMSSVVFGYLVGYQGNYNHAILPLALMAFIGAMIFWTINPNEQLVPENDTIAVPN